ncbi:MAG: hypothetical protein CMM58_03365 [Rhodospirillaceae bacterium]|nr:hypothetical protein [Rhodospirillaceae bacterium]
MQVLLTTITRRRNGSIGRKTETISCNTFRIGRDTKDELFLPDHRIPYNLATLREGVDGFFVEAEGQNDIRLNGIITKKSQLKAGDTLGIGPYEIKIEESTPDVDLRITLELIHPMGDDVEELLSRSTLTIKTLGVTKRALSWTLALSIIVAFLILPILDATFDAFDSFGKVEVSDSKTMAISRNNRMNFDVSWHTGEMLDSHKFFSNDCGVCHTKPFIMVENDACIACHQAQHGHIDKVTFAKSELNSTRCATCHTDHQGPDPVRATQQALCSSCHMDLATKENKARFANVSDFGTDHPQFKPTIWINASTGTRERVSLDDDPRENSNLKFPHKSHLNAKLMRNPRTGKQEQLVCTSCHLSHMDGQFLKPVSMEEHCSDCHILSFDPGNPQRLVSHGQPHLIEQELIEYYSKLALNGLVNDASAPKVLRRRPGTVLNEEERMEALKWAKYKTKEASNYLFSANQCGSCHVVTVNPEKKALYSIAPVKVTNIWQPHSVFHHGKHRDIECKTCHDADSSLHSSDVLLPKLEDCRECHGGQSASNKIPSTCISCHVFHNDEIALMAPEIKRK